LRMAKRRWFARCMADSTGRTLSYGQVLVGSLLLAHWLRRQRPHDNLVGLLLPASVARPLANIAALLPGHVPASVNFTARQEAVAAALQQCEIRTLLTSRTFLTKAQIAEMEGMVFLEEVTTQFSSVKKLLTLLVAFFAPARLLQALYNRERRTPESLATIVFSSGSTGTPKGVMLSHHNILSNVEAIQQVFAITKKDCIMGVLPFFHAFGFTGTLWLPLIAGFRAAYHPNPLDAKTIGEMVNKHQATILISTPTFCTAYLRKCSAEVFSSLRYVIVG